MQITYGWLALFTRVLAGLTFAMPAINKVFVLGPMGHATQFFTGPYADTWIPQWMLLITGVSIPIVELLGGWFLVIGFLRRPTAVALGFVLLLVAYGHLLKEPLYDITVHILTRTMLLIPTWMLSVEHDPWSADALWTWWRGRKAAA